MVTSWCELNKARQRSSLTDMTVKEVRIQHLFFNLHDKHIVQGSLAVDRTAAWCSGGHEKQLHCESAHARGVRVRGACVKARHREPQGLMPEPIFANYQWQEMKYKSQ